MSDVWKYFEKSVESNKAKCSLCAKLLSYCGGTNNLWEHLLTKQLVQLEQAAKVMAAMRITLQIIRSVVEM